MKERYTWSMVAVGPLSNVLRFHHVAYFSIIRLSDQGHLHMCRVQQLPCAHFLDERNSGERIIR